MTVHATVLSRPDASPMAEVTLGMTRREAEVLRRFMYSHAPGGDPHSISRRINSALEAAGIKMAEWEAGGYNQ